MIYRTYSYAELTYNKVMFIRDSRRSYRTYCYSELIIVFRILYLYYGAYTCILDLILVLQN